ncbi:MAG: amino acid ABC transporter substrate-binding protein, partial [Actinomycetota bacterium]|nr:amino acid ABC transporter substrate-binding protein [Actinomycetota bacterium]
MQLKSLATAKISAKAAALLAVGVLSLTACGGGNTAPAATSSEGGVTLINAGKLTVCSDVPYEPFEFQKDGKIVGFDMDIA